MAERRFFTTALASLIAFMAVGLEAGRAEEVKPGKEKVTIDRSEPGWKEIWAKKKAEKRDYRVYLARGLLAREDGEYKDAIGHFNKALKYRPGCAQAHHFLAACEAKCGKPNDAAASYRKAIVLKPDLKEAYYELGMLYVREYRTGSAEAQLEKLKPLDAKLAAELEQAIQKRKDLLKNAASGGK